MKKKFKELLLKFRMWNPKYFPNPFYSPSLVELWLSHNFLKGMEKGITEGFLGGAVGTLCGEDEIGLTEEKMQEAIDLFKDLSKNKPFMPSMIRHHPDTETKDLEEYRDSDKLFFMGIDWAASESVPAGMIVMTGSSCHYCGGSYDFIRRCPSKENETGLCTPKIVIFQEEEDA